MPVFDCPLLDEFERETLAIYQLLEVDPIRRASSDLCFPFLAPSTADEPAEDAE